MFAPRRGTPMRVATADKDARYVAAALSFPAGPVLDVVDAAAGCEVLVSVPERGSLSAPAPPRINCIAVGNVEIGNVWDKKKGLVGMLLCLLEERHWKRRRGRMKCTLTTLSHRGGHTRANIYFGAPSTALLDCGPRACSPSSFIPTLSCTNPHCLALLQCPRIWRHFLCWLALEIRFADGTSDWIGTSRYRRDLPHTRHGRPCHQA